jgi:hypothetical protein
MGTIGLLREAVSIASWLRESSGGPVAGLIQDVSAAADLATNIGSYESELIQIQGTITSAFGAAGGFYSAANLSTAGVPGDPNLKLRVPNSLLASLGLATGMHVMVTTPLWRFHSIARDSLDAVPARGHPMTLFEAGRTRSERVRAGRRWRKRFQSAGGPRVAFLAVRRWAPTLRCHPRGHERDGRKRSGHQGQNFGSVAPEVTLGGILLCR